MLTDASHLLEYITMVIQRFVAMEPCMIGMIGIRTVKKKLGVAEMLYTTS